MARPLWYKHCETCGIIMPREWAEEGCTSCKGGCILPPKPTRDVFCKNCGRRMVSATDVMLCRDCEWLARPHSCVRCGKQIPYRYSEVEIAADYLCDECNLFLKKKAKFYRDIKRPNLCSSCGRPLHITTVDAGFHTCPICRARATQLREKLTKTKLSKTNRKKWRKGPPRICLICDRVLDFRSDVYCPRCLARIRRKAYTHRNNHFDEEVALSFQRAKERTTPTKEQNHGPESH